MSHFKSLQSKIVGSRNTEFFLQLKKKSDPFGVVGVDVMAKRHNSLMCKLFPTQVEFQQGHHPIPLPPGDFQDLPIFLAPRRKQVVFFDSQE